MDYVWAILAVISAVGGIIGAIIPGLPGTPLSFASLLLLLLVSNSNYGAAFLVIMGVIALAITLLDYYVPIYGTKRLGGTRSGVRGSTIGLIIGVFILPLLGITIGPLGILGIVLGPFLGAYIGELYAGNRTNALRSALGSFIGFLAGTLMKLLYGIIVLIFVIKDGITFLFL